MPIGTIFAKQGHLQIELLQQTTHDLVAHLPCVEEAQQGSPLRIKDLTQHLRRRDPIDIQTQQGSRLRCRTWSKRTRPQLTREALRTHSPQVSSSTGLLALIVCIALNPKDTREHSKGQALNHQGGQDDCEGQKNDEITRWQH